MGCDNLKMVKLLRNCRSCGYTSCQGVDPLLDVHEVGSISITTPIAKGVTVNITGGSREGTLKVGRCSIKAIGAEPEYNEIVILSHAEIVFGSSTNTAYPKGANITSIENIRDYEYCYRFRQLRECLAAASNES